MKKKYAPISFSFIVLSFAVFSLLYYLFFRSSFFSVQTIHCSQSVGACSADIIAELERYRGVSSLFLNTQTISQRIERADTTVRSASVSIQWPHTLSLNITGRIPTIQLAFSTDLSHVFLADADAFIIGSGTRHETLPLIVLEEMDGLSVGEKLQERLRIGIAFVNDLRDQLSENDQPTIKNDLLLITLSDGVRVRISLSKPRAQQFAALQLLLNQARIEGIRYREIDLRFSKPIVKK